MYQLLSGKQGFAPGAWNSEVVPWQRDDPEGQECAERRGWCASEHPPAASTGIGAPDSSRIVLEAAGDSLRRQGSADFPPLITRHQDSFWSTILGLCIRSKNPNYTPGCCKDIFPLLPDRVLEKRRQRETGRFPSCLSPGGCIISKLLALKLGVKSSISNSIPIFCWNYNNPKSQHVQNYELNI